MTYWTIQWNKTFIIDDLFSLLLLLKNVKFSPVDVTVQFLEVEALILVVIQLCQRNSGKMDEAGREVVYTCSLLQTVSLREQIILYYCRFVTNLT